MADLLYNLLPQPRREIVYIHPDLSVYQCCQIMFQRNIGALVVTDDDNLIGIVSERDVVRQCVCEELNPHRAKALDITHADVSILDVHETVDRAMQIITESKRRHVLVSELGLIIGIVSIGDLLFHILEERARTIAHLENYINS